MTRRIDDAIVNQENYLFSTKKKNLCESCHKRKGKLRPFNMRLCDRCYKMGLDFKG